MESPQYRISQGVVDAPPPPLAGSLAAWLGRRGHLVRIVDPRGESEDWSGTGPLWIHLDTGFAEQRLAAIHDSEDLRFFGPALNQEHCRNDLRRHFNLATLVPGDPESHGGDPIDLADLPITSYAGFGEQPGGLFRLLAGRGRRQRPIALLCREIAYLVETFAAGHLLFDDEDLGRYPGWLEAFSTELKALPWPLSWEGTLNGKHARGRGRQGAQ
jgi:hypothetical protein